MSRNKMAPLSGWFPWTPRRAAKVVLAILLIPMCMCGPASHWAWPQAWIVALLPLLLFLLPTALYINKYNPDLLDERESFITNTGVPEFDRILAPVVVGLSIPMYLSAGLQHRYHPEMLLSGSHALSLAALTVDVLAILWQNWAICANHWFSSVVRLQTNRGHKVCSTGPYAYVRHPAYVGLCFEHVAEAVLLQSTWYLAVGILRGAVLAVSLLLKDSF